MASVSQVAFVCTNDETTMKQFISKYNKWYDYQYQSTFLKPYVINLWRHIPQRNWPPDDKFNCIIGDIEIYNALKITYGNVFPECTDNDVHKLLMNCFDNMIISRFPFSECRSNECIIHFIQYNPRLGPSVKIYYDDKNETNELALKLAKNCGRKWDLIYLLLESMFHIRHMGRDKHWYKEHNPELPGFPDFDNGFKQLREIINQEYYAKSSKSLEPFYRLYNAFMHIAFRNTHRCNPESYIKINEQLKQLHMFFYTGQQDYQVLLSICNTLTETISKEYNIARL